MAFNPIVALGGIAAAALIVMGATTAIDWFSATERQPLAIVELVTLAPGSFRHPQPGEFMSQSHPIAAPLILATVGVPLEIMKYQVSRSEYGRCVTAGACKPADIAGDGNFPVTGVSHIDAEAYAAWFSVQMGARWRLPTDAEWAYAASERFRSDIEGGATDPNNPALRWLAQYRIEAALGRVSDPEPRFRGAFGINSKGLADVASNVWEWTSTCYVHATIAADGDVTLSGQERDKTCGADFS
ncbi:SUMF1/EgtB/PvdO family nonheme iron enzyme (plasmid) [Mesorhizobium sp. INR15]|nr:SUMF1/EgtB/PvdO family nonheme iron enzyme [Mesorhizobium sp. INR15]